MAKITAAAAPAHAAPPAAAPAKKSRKRLLIVLALLIVAAGGGGGAWYLLRPAPGAEAATTEALTKPIFLPFDTFTVNLAEEGGDHYLQIGIVYQIANDQVADSIKVYMPVLRNRLLLLLSAKRPSELVTPEGKQKLVDELVVAAREAVPEGNDKKGIVSALLSSFVIQ